MPILSKSTYRSPFWLLNAHLATIFPSIFRKVEGVEYLRERITTPDDDFMDLDWIKNDSKNLLLLAHGLEGDSERHYMKGPAKYFSDRHWDVVAWNCRSCSGEMNRQPRLYHHAATDDLEIVIDHINENKDYDRIVLAGFSMGGSIILKYLGEDRKLPDNIVSSINFSVPCDLKASAVELSKFFKSFYRKKFLKKLKVKMTAKAQQFPELVSVDNIELIDSFPKFDERYTAPIHGFKNAVDFYHKASVKNYLQGIRIPTLIVNALNDPFFSKACYPFAEVKNMEQVYLETPKRGGHVGFMINNRDSWMETRMWVFVNTNL